MSNASSWYTEIIIKGYIPAMPLIISKDFTRLIYKNAKIELRSLTCSQNNTANFNEVSKQYRLCFCFGSKKGSRSRRGVTLTSPYSVRKFSACAVSVHHGAF